jgi:hypothetical protein
MAPVAAIGGRALSGPDWPAGHDHRRHHGVCADADPAQPDWGVVTKPHESGLVIIVKNGVVSLAIVITIGFMMLVSLLVDVALTTLIASARDWLPLAP